MIKRLRVTVCSNEQFTDRERKMIDVFMLNLGVFVNAIHKRYPMTTNPVESPKVDFGMDFTFNQPIDDEVGEKMAADLDKRLRLMFGMSNIKIENLSVFALPEMASPVIH